MRYYDGRFLVYDSETGFQVNDLDRESLYKIGNASQVTLKIHEGTGLLLPFMNAKPLGDPNIFNLKDWIRLMIQNEGKEEFAKKALIDQFTTAGIQFTPEDVDAIIQGPLLAKRGENSSLNPNLAPFVKDPLARKNFRKRTLVEDAKYEHPNVTLEQMTEFDALGVKLPPPGDIYRHQLGEPYSETQFPATYSAYPNRLYRMAQIEGILNAPDKTTQLSRINVAIDILTKTYEEPVSAQEIKEMRGAFKALPAMHVLGNPDNDTMGIQEHEKSFYENLITFMEYHIYKFNEEVMQSATEEEVQAKTEADIKSGRLPQRLQEYLLQLLKDALSKNFYHTGNFNYVIGDFEESGLGDDDRDDEDKGVLIAKSSPTMSDLHYVAANYLISSAERYGISAWAEGIVKSMRWGENKVRNLNVGINNTQYFDMYTMNFVTQQISDLTQFQVATDSSGRSLDIMDYTYVDFTAKGQYGAISYPFLLAGVEYGDLPGVEESISVGYLTTVFDIVKDYQAGTETVYDLGYVNGKFVDEVEREKFYEVELGTLQKRGDKIKISEELINYAIDNAVPRMEGTAFALTSPISLEDIKNDEPLLNRLGEVSKSFRREEVHGGLLAVFSEGGSDHEFAGLAELLNWYQEEVYPTHLEGYNKLFGFNIETKLNVTNLATSHFFEDTEVVEEEEENKFMYPIYEGEQLSFNKIVKSAADETVIGGYAVLPTGEQVFASTTEMESVAISGESLVIGKVIVRLFETMLSADTRNDFKSKTKVISETSVFDIYKALYQK